MRMDMSQADLELQGIDRAHDHADAMAPDGGAGSPGVSSSLLDHSSLGEQSWEDGTLREDVGERWRPKDLDSFFQRIYEYFKERGYLCIVMGRLLNVAALAFLTAFSTFLLAYVNWHEVLACTSIKCPEDKVLKAEPFGNMLHGDFYELFVFVFTMVMCLFISKEIVVGCHDVKEFYLIKRFVNDKLGISEREMRTILWPDLVQRILKLQEDGVLIVKHTLTPLDIANRIMRKDNYFMAMINKDVIDLRLPCPGFSHNSILTKTMEWNLNYCIMSNMFDPTSFTVRERFVSDPAALSRRFMICGVVNLMLSPFIMVFMLIYFFFKHAQSFKTDPSMAGTRNWSHLARWKVREFNELDHFFENRINSSFKAANEYVLQFPSNEVAVVAKFIVFVAGSFASVLILLSLTDETLLLYVEIQGHNLLWYITVFGIIAAAGRPFVVDKHTVFDPEAAFAKVADATHYYPRRWRRKVHTYDVYDEFTSMFRYKVVSFLQEIVGVAVVPFWLLLCLPQQSQQILQFVHEFTETKEDLGDVCAFAVFDFECHGNANYGAHVRRDKKYRSKQGKMEKSLVTFKENNPDWVPGPQGQMLLNNLKAQQDLSASQLMASQASMAEKVPDMGSLHSSMEDLYVANTSGPGSDNPGNIV